MFKPSFQGARFNSVKQEGVKRRRRGFSAEGTENEGPQEGSGTSQFVSTVTEPLSLSVF